MRSKQILGSVLMGVSSQKRYLGAGRRSPAEGGCEERFRAGGRTIARCRESSAGVRGNVHLPGGECNPRRVPWRAAWVKKMTFEASTDWAEEAGADSLLSGFSEVDEDVLLVDVEDRPLAE